MMGDNSNAAFIKLKKLIVLIIINYINILIYVILETRRNFEARSKFYYNILFQFFVDWSLLNLPLNSK